MEIVTLPVEDWQEYRALRLRALKEDPQAFSSAYADAAQWAEEQWKVRLLDALKGERSWLFFAREGGKLVGMIGAFIDEASPETATIISVYVPAEERGRGISAELMLRMLRELSRRPALKTATLTVNRTQLAAVHLYSKFGFEAVGSTPGVTGEGKPVEEVIMERSLPY
jgi:RimJ/RimL family protein N-acetyltransferase